MADQSTINVPGHVGEQSPTEAVALSSTTSGAVAVIAIAGKKTGEALRKICHLDPAGLRWSDSGRIVRTDFFHNEEVFDNGLIVLHSPTHIEFHLHGGTAVVARAMAALQETGIRAVSAAESAAGNFPQSIPFQPQPQMPDSLLLRELWFKFCYAKSDAAVDQLAGQLNGGLANWVNQWKSRIAASPATASQLQLLNFEAQWIRDQAAWASFLLQPPVLAIIGAPNAGKSTLLNALTGRPASIVSNIPGTTRDWVDEPAFLSCGPTRIAVQLVDTAGIRLTQDSLEAISIERTGEQLAEADLLLFLADQSRRLDKQTASILDRLANNPARNQPLILVATKTDLPAQWNPLAEYPKLPAVRICSPELAGFAELAEVIFGALGLAKLSPAADVAFACTARQIFLLDALAMAPTLADAQRTIEELKG